MPASLGASGVLVASAPLGRCAAGAVVPLADCLPRQVLFGWEAQMQAFASQIATLGRTLFVVPAPEIFSSRESHAHIARATGWDGRGAAMAAPSPANASPPASRSPICHRRPRAARRRAWSAAMPRA